MKTPKGQPDTNFTFEQIKNLIDLGFWSNPSSCRQLLDVCVEKLRCCQKADSINEVRCIIKRPEWMRGEVVPPPETGKASARKDERSWNREGETY